MYTTYVLYATGTMPDGRKFGNQECPPDFELSDAIARREGYKSLGFKGTITLKSRVIVGKGKKQRYEYTDMETVNY